VFLKEIPSIHEERLDPVEVVFLHLRVVSRVGFMHDGFKEIDLGLGVGHHRVVLPVPGAQRLQLELGLQKGALGVGQIL